MDKIRYQIIVTIKESNKGSVCLAKVEGYEFPVIVKKLKHGNQEVFRTLQVLDCIYVPKIYEVEESPEGLLVVEEYIEGELLSDYIASAQLPDETWIDIAKQLCEALSALHKHVPPVIHRDIKPSNIILNSKGRIKLIDFDSSRLFKEESSGDTRLLGTERYAPPEQYGFSQTDCRSDIYSLGVVLGMFPAFSSKAKQKRWKRLVEKCTLFAPESRYQSVETVKKELIKISGICKRIGQWTGVTAGFLLVLSVVVMIWWRSTAAAPVVNQETQTPTGVPTAVLIPDKIPTPTIAPLTNELPSLTLVPEIDELYRMTPPAWRKVEDEIPAFVSLKEQIQENHLTVEYCFKDRLSEGGFLLLITWMEQPEIEFCGLNLYSYQDDLQTNIDESFYEVDGSIICLGKEYMQSLKEGYYSAIVSMHNAENDHSINHSVILYIAESDVWENQEAWLQNTTMSYYGAEGETLRNVVLNESANEIVSLLYQDRTPVEASLYRIIHGGRAIEFSNELLCQLRNEEVGVFYVIGKDGTDMKIRIENHISDVLE